MLMQGLAAERSHNQRFAKQPRDCAHDSYMGMESAGVAVK